MRKLRSNELGRLTAEQYKQSDKTPIVVVLDNIRSANNVGSVFRTSDAFLIEKIILCGITATPPSAEIHKTALDAEKTVEWEYCKNTLDAVLHLKNDDYSVFAIEQVENSTLLPDFKPNTYHKIAIVFGNEVKGVQQKVINECDGSIEIPQFGMKHSFNISVSAGIVLWDLFRKMKEDSCG